MAARLQLSGFEEKWTPVLTAWLDGVLRTPLPGAGIALNQLSEGDKQVEMAFYLPIEQPLDPLRLDALIRQYDPLSVDTPTLDFRQVRGMLKGFIDLVFRHNGRYYLLDYKSNWLGKIARPIPRTRCGRQCVRTVTICSISSIAWRCTDIYATALPIMITNATSAALFISLRGMDGQDGGQGIFATRPALPLINGLDALFAGESQEVVL